MNSSSHPQKVNSKRKRVEDRENEDCLSEHIRKRTRHSSSSSSCSSSPPSTPLSPVNRDLLELRRNIDEPSSSKGEMMTSRTTKTSWLNRAGIMSLLVGKDPHVPSPSWTYFSQHPTIQPKMRSVLLDWLIEVSEVYNLQRETYYLAVNYIDRYLSVTQNILKSNLQLIGITCLFIASKVEEIYPPKLERFAYVTDEACSVDDIIKQELNILSKLDWEISAMTVNSWMNLLLQLCNNRDAPAKNIIFPNHPIKDYVATAQLLDLAVLDDGSLRFSYQSLAIAAIYLSTEFQEILNVPLLGDERPNMVECLTWMIHFQKAIKEKCSPIKVLSSTDAGYTIQKHHVDIPLLEHAQHLMQQFHSSTMLTPPSSHEKIL